jgi:hypothetical protein
VGTTQDSYLPVATIEVSMIFEWDNAMNRANIRKHGLDFADAEETFRSVLVVDVSTHGGIKEKGDGLDWAQFAVELHMWCSRYPALRPFGSSH